jgi:hypothetical protein
MATIFRHPKRKMYYHRSTVPISLQRFLKGREEIWRSLKTADKAEAKVRSAAWESRVQRLFLMLGREGDRMTEEQREALVSHWLEVELDYAEECRATEGRISEAWRERQLEGLSVLADEAHEALTDNDYRKIEKMADELLRSAGLPLLDHDAADFGRLCRRLLLAQQEYARIESERWQGIYNNHRPVHVASTNGSSLAAAPKPKTPTGPLFSVAVEKYMKENPRVVRTAIPMRAEFKKFLDTIGGDKPIDAITKSDGRIYEDAGLTGERR